MLFVAMQELMHMWSCKLIENLVIYDMNISKCKKKKKKKKYVTNHHNTPRFILKSALQNTCSIPSLN